MDDHRGTEQPVGYMERTRLYYRALGYEQDYVWSTYDDVPFARLGAPLSESKIALITTVSIAINPPWARSIAMSFVRPSPEGFASTHNGRRDESETTVALTA